MTHPTGRASTPPQPRRAPSPRGGVAVAQRRRPAPAGGALTEVAVPEAPPPRVTVITVCYLTGPLLFDHIESVLGDDGVTQHVIIDNGSTPEDALRLRYIASQHPDRIVLRQGHGNIGFASACNTGAGLATGDYLVFLNPDAVLQPGSIHSLIRTRMWYGGPSLIGGRLANPDGSEQPGGRRNEVTPLTTLLTLSHLTKRFPHLDRFEIHRDHDPAPPNPVEIATISGAFFLMTREDYALVGGFDVGYFLHVEDIDLCWRVRCVGGVVVYDPDAWVVHHGSTSLVDPVWVEFHKARGLCRYFRKRRKTLLGKAGVMLVSPLVVAAGVARALVFKLKG